MQKARFIALHVHGIGKAYRAKPVHVERDVRIWQPLVMEWRDIGIRPLPFE